MDMVELEKIGHHNIDYKYRYNSTSTTSTSKNHYKVIEI